MEFLLIGIIVGMVMGLTGAGGALISIPLFINVLNTTIKEATVLSLIAVLFGTSINLFGQRYKIDKKVVFLFVTFGAIANYASLPLKKTLPDMYIASMLLLIGAYSIWSIWRKNTFNRISKQKVSLSKTAIIGLGLGLVTTLTGLGGGVLLVPILMMFYGKSYEESLPTSLMTIFLISFISLSLQAKVGLSLISFPSLIYMALGTSASYFVLKWSVTKLSKEKMLTARKMVFTLVAVYSISSVLIQSI